MNPKISILLAAYKSNNLLKRVFYPSWLDNCSVDVELIIYDNGGNKDLDHLEWDKSTDLCFPGRILIFGKKDNIGLNAALNKCAEKATGEYYFLPHTDMYLMPGWDTALLEATKNHPPGSQLLCSRSIEPTKGHTDYHIIKDYGKEWHEFNEEQLLKDFSEYSNRSIVTGYRMPFFLHKNLWELMGGVDASYFSYCTDDDLVQTAYDVGVRKFWMVYDSLVYHLQGKSNLQQKVDRNSQQPYTYFVEKWRTKGYLEARHPGQWHPELIPWYINIQ